MDEARLRSNVYWHQLKQIFDALELPKEKTPSGHTPDSIDVLQRR
jgi:hypothetical protein